MDYVVKRGDTLGSIASRFGVSVNDILRANPQITNPNVISVGQVIRIPRRGAPPPTVRGRRYVIRAGDTLGNIAARFGVTVNAILRANPQITNPELIYPGMVIIIPGARVVPPERPRPGRRSVYIVQRGDTLSAIARRFGVTVADILSINPQITDPNRLQVGQRIFIPAT
jgi:spore coat assembly protein SafA